MKVEEQVVAVEVEQTELVFVELTEDEMEAVAGGGGFSAGHRRPAA